jgi:flagellar basal-body rod protein FlgF
VTSFCRFGSPSTTGLIGVLARFLSGLRHRGRFGTAVALTSAGMDTLTAAGASGLRARLESLEMLANNMANATTSGYKSDQEFYGIYRSTEGFAEASDSIMPVIERPWTDYSQGTLVATGNALDLALSGKGFFAVQGPSGPLYTRNGGFHVAPDGKLTTAEGYAVQGAGGKVLQFAAGTTAEIAPDGTVTQDGQTIGQLAVVDFTSTAGLQKQGKTYFRQTDAKLRPGPSAARVEQGKTEASNVGTAESAVRLVNVMRQFEMLQKAVGMGLEMNRRAIEEVAKVGA